MRDLVPQPGIEPGLPALGARSLTHWTTGEVPIREFLVLVSGGGNGLAIREMRLSIFIKLAVDINYTSNKLPFQYALKQNDIKNPGLEAKLC